jgi:hypothetical protein
MSFLTAALSHADVTTTFPSDDSFSCNIGFCTLLGDNGGRSPGLFTAGDFVSETFNTGQTSITGLSYDFFLIDTLGLNPGAEYQTGIYVNDVLVGAFSVPDCNSCGSQMEFSGILNFAAIEGDGTYDISIVLLDTVPTGDGSFAFLAPGTITLKDGNVTTPEPGTFVLFASGILGMAGWIRRRSSL